MGRSPTTERTAAKHEAMLAAAESMFLSDGFAATRMTDIAEAVGVTANAVYWYFDSKDALLVAVVERWTDVLLRQAERSARSPSAAAVHPAVSLVVGALRELRPLLGTLHERAARADVVRQFDRRLHRRVERVVSTALAGTYPDKRDAELAGAVIVAAVEGALMRPGGPARANEVIEAAVRTFAGGEIVL